ncbi:hypothetical protein D9M70_400810 [compost metagenome]
MPLQTASALDQQVDRGHIADHGIEVQIEGLLHHLGRYQHPALTLCSTGVLAEQLQGALLDIQPVAHGEAAMEQQKTFGRH